MEKKINDLNENSSLEEIMEIELEIENMEDSNEKYILQGMLEVKKDSIINNNKEDNLKETKDDKSINTDNGIIEDNFKDTLGYKNINTNKKANNGNLKVRIIAGALVLAVSIGGVILIKSLSKGDNNSTGNSTTTDYDDLNNEKLKEYKKLSDNGTNIKDEENFTNEIADKYVGSIAEYVKNDAVPDSSKIIVERSTQLDSNTMRYYCYCYDDTGAYTKLLYITLFKNEKAVKGYLKTYNSGCTIVGNGYSIFDSNDSNIKFIGTDYNTTINLIGKSCNSFGDKDYSNIDCPNPDPIFSVDLDSNTIIPIEHTVAVPSGNDHYLTELRTEKFNNENCMLTTDYTFDQDTMELTSMSESYEFGPEVNVLAAVNFSSLNERILQNGVCGNYSIIDDENCRTLKLVYNENYFEQYMYDTTYEGIKADLNEAYIICDTYANGIQR